MHADQGRLPKLKPTPLKYGGKEEAEEKLCAADCADKRSQEETYDGDRVTEKSGKPVRSVQDHMNQPQIFTVVGVTKAKRWQFY